ncbi:MAG TPA: HepT-like ribonuclease domain-containing protein [Pseudonocardia sp.]|nr:HepT-like ribonuclease domain-containing protein [Pseudonocardia sp.]
MTPPALDWRSVERKLTRIRVLVDQLAALGPFDGRRFVDDPVAGFAAERLLTLLVELAFSVNSHVSAAVLARAPDTYRESFLLAARVGVIDEKLAASLAPAAGLRNVLVHAYLDVEHDLVAEATRLAPEQFGEYVRQASRWFAERSGAV